MNIDSPQMPKYGIFEKLFYFVVLNHEPFAYHIGKTEILGVEPSESGFEYKCKSFLSPVPESCLFETEEEATDAKIVYLIERKRFQEQIDFQNNLSHEPE